jgi:hypothetical protein
MGYCSVAPSKPHAGSRRLQDGIVVYSIGRDRKDDGGKINRAKPEAPGGDLGFRLWDIDKRRQAPPKPKDETKPVDEPESGAKIEQDFPFLFL